MITINMPEFEDRNEGLKNGLISHNIRLTNNNILIFLFSIFLNEYDQKEKIKGKNIKMKPIIPN